MNIKEIESRRSVRKYQDRPVEREKLEQILQAALLAPSAKNRQPWRYIVLTGAKKDEMIDVMLTGIANFEKSIAGKFVEKSRLANAKNTASIMKKAPAIIVTLDTCSKGVSSILASASKIEMVLNTLSIGAAVQNMLLEADSLGLGTLWIGNTFFAYKEIMKWLGTSDSLVGAVAVGYTEGNPGTRPRKELSEVVTWEA